MVKSQGAEGEISEEPKENKLTDIPGIGPGIAMKLESAGIYDLMGLAVLSPSALAEMAGVGEAVARKAIQAARGMMKLGFMDASEFEEKRKDVHYTTTGSKNLDALLGGRGIESRAITEAYGAFGSGKCVSKDTEVCYFNNEMHVEQIEKTYEKYKAIQGENKFEEGFVVPINTVKVLSWNEGQLKIVDSTFLYKEKISKVFNIETRRGRILKVTGNHQILSFDNGVTWRKTGSLKKGDLIASPKNISFSSKNALDEEDAYFLGLYIAEGTFNPFSLCISDEGIRDWVVSYCEKKFGFTPTVRHRKEENNSCFNYTILFRNNMRNFMEGLDKCNSESKFIPEKVFMADEQVILSFLGGYFDGDGEVSKEDVSATTKSKKLATQLSYLLLRIGAACSIRDKKVDDKSYYVVRVCGEDRVKMRDVKFKAKTFDPHMVNSFYGYPKTICSYIEELYRDVFGGNRGRLRKEVGKKNVDRYIYDTLMGRTNTLTINSKTLDNIEALFRTQNNAYIDFINKLEKNNFSTALLKEIYPKLPFAFNKLADKLGIKKKSIQNYYSRKLPETKSELLRNLIYNELKARVDAIYLGLELINEIRLFNWDIVDEIEVCDYNDYVYDFVVPEGHSFIGGNLPTMMHNSQLGFSLAVNVQLPREQGGAEGKAVFIDTEGTFRPERIKQIALGIGANPDIVLKNILVARAFNSDHQILLLDKISELIKNGEPIKIIIIDSLTAHFRAEFSGRGQLADRQQKLNKYLHSLMKLAEQSNLAVYVTNQVMANPGMMFGDPTTPIGGHIVGHMCLSGDSLIQLADGSIKEIKEIKEDRVLGGNFLNMGLEKADSDKLFINSEVKEIYNIKTNCQINCSPLHRFFTVNNFNVCEREAKDLKDGDFIAQARRIEIEGEDRAVPMFKIKRIGRISKEEGRRISKKLGENNIARKDVCSKIGINSRQFRRVLNQEYPTSFEVLDKIQNYFSGELVLQMVPAVSNKHKNIQMPQFLSSQLSQIFGYFWGDGNFEKSGLRFKDERLGVIQHYNHLFKQVFNIDGHISKVNNKNCYALSINSKEIRDLFEIYIEDVLNEIGRSKEDVIGGFIRGFIDAEGYIHKKGAHIHVVQKEPLVLRYLQLFLLRLGIRSTIKSGIGSQKVNVLRIKDRDVLDYSAIGFTALDKQQRLIEVIDEYKEKYTKEMMPIRRTEIAELLKVCGLKPFSIIKSRPESYIWTSRNELERAFNLLMQCNVKDRQIKQKIDFISLILQGAISFEKIRKISISKNNGELLYDFSVPKMQNYIANGFVVHNSTYRLYFRRGKAGSRVAKMIDSPNLPDNETQFFVTSKGVRDEGTEE